MTDEALIAAEMFMGGKVPEPLTAEERQWLADQLHQWPKRVHDDRTCAVGALTDMATAEFCRMMAERRAIASSDRADLVRRVEDLEAELTVARQLAYAAGRDDLVASFDATLNKGE